MQKEEIEYAVKRIEHMEKIFDETEQAFKNDPYFYKDESAQKKVSLLRQYMESGQWLRDFSLDEKGELPSGLKRGILSEDGLYNLLSAIEKEQNKGFFKKLSDKIKSVF